MTPVAPPTFADPEIKHPRPRFTSKTVWLAFFLLVLWFVLCRFLGLEWSANEQYRYGWFVPFLAAYLFWLRWEVRPAPAPTDQRHLLRIRLVGGAFALLLLLPIRLVEVASPDWRLLGWIHAGIAAAVTLLIIWSAGGRPWLRHFLFPVAFFFVAVPWVLTIEYYLVQDFMRFVAAAAAELLTWFAIPAAAEGSLIRVNNGVVGVSEACSGIRSLQTSLMLGLLFGELKHFNAARRTGLVLGAAAVALFANFCRAFFLVWVAAGHGLAATEKWHDLAGYAIVGVVFLGTLLIAYSLGSSSPGGASSASPSPSTPPHPNESPRRSSFAFPFSAATLATALVWLLLVEAGVEAWYRAHERNARPTASWTVKWPESAAGFHDIHIDDLVKDSLHFDQGREAVWSAASDGGSSNQFDRWLMFFFRWNPGTTTIIRARAHHPDVCLPSVGWKQTATAPIRYYKIAPNVTLPFRHASFALDLPGQPKLFAHVFFCTHEDIVRPSQAPGAFDASSTMPVRWGRYDMVRLAADGLRSPGQQVLELIRLTSKPVGMDEADVEFRATLSNIATVQPR